MSEVTELYNEAFGAFSSGDHERAIAGFQKLIKTDPSFSLAYQGLSEVFAREERLDEAIQTIQQAIELEPEESLYYTSLSRFLQRQGRIPEAEAAAAQAARFQSS